MDEQDQQLAQQLREGLEKGGYQTAFGDEAGAEAEIDNPLESDFFKALNAFRAARTSGDKDAMDRAEENLRNVVRGELTGE